MSEVPLRLEPNSHSSLPCMYLFGLRTFFENRVADDRDLGMEFLRDLTCDSACSLLIGWNALNAFVDSAEEIPYCAKQAGRCIVAGFDLAETTFTTVNWGPVPPPLFIRDANGIWACTDPSDVLEIATYGLWSAALAWFVHMEDRGAVVEHVLVSGGQNADNILRTLIDACEIVALAGHDGQYLELYSRDFDRAGLERAVDAANRMITSSEWYRRNHHRLRWDDWKLCLVLAE